VSGGERLALGLIGLLFALVLAVVYAPVLIVVAGAFVLTPFGDLDWSRPTLAWFAGLAHNRQILDALENTLIAGAGSVAAATLLGTLTAAHVHGRPHRRHRLLQALIFLPFLLPPLIVGLSLLIYFRQVGIPTGLQAVIVGHTLFVLAVVFRTVLNRLKQLGRSQIEASADLGARPLQTLRFVVLPQIASSLTLSAILAFTLSFDETLISLFLVGDQNTLPIMLWAMMRTGISPEVNALAAILLAVSLALILFAGLRFMRDNTQEEAKS
jgi:putative spermidine/putrescine transport system permease protein/spermidine/putrescine transport system permease protein